MLHVTRSTPVLTSGSSRLLSTEHADTARETSPQSTALCPLTTSLLARQSSAGLGTSQRTGQGRVRGGVVPQDMG